MHNALSAAEGLCLKEEDGFLCVRAATLGVAQLGVGQTSISVMGSH